MEAFEKIEIDLTSSLANCGKKIPFCGDFSLSSELLPYPNATLNKVSLDFFVTFTKPNIAVEGNILCDISGKCDRCGEDVEKIFNLPFAQIFFKDSAPEEDGYVYSGSKLDATKAIEDEIVLALPTLLLCDENCKGLCPKCGANKNLGECGCDTSRENVFSALKGLFEDN